MEQYKKIDYRTAVDFLLPRHYSGRVPVISYAYGLYNEGRLMAVCTFGTPASPPLCKGVAGDKFKHRVLELNRLCKNAVKPLFLDMGKLGRRYNNGRY